MGFETMGFGKQQEEKQKKKSWLKKSAAFLAAGLASQAINNAEAKDITGTAEKMGGTEKVMQMTAEELNDLQEKPNFAENYIKKAPIIGGKALEGINDISDPSFENADDSKVRIAEGVKSNVVKNFNSLSNRVEAPEKGLSQEIISGRDAGFFENLSKIHPGWQEKPVGSIVSLLNKNSEIEVGEELDLKAVKAAKKLNILCGGFQKYKNLGEVVEVASENAKKMNMHLSSSEIESIL